MKKADEPKIGPSARMRMHTVTFQYPKEFRTAVARMLGRSDGIATLGETETFLREAITANVDALIEEHCRPPKKTFKIKRA